MNEQKIAKYNYFT